MDTVKEIYPNAHILPLSYDSLGIDDARDITVLTDGNSELKIIVIHTHVITPEAQNYFLKPLEELHENIKIVFLFSGVPVLLPTFLSRGIVMQTDLNRTKNPDNEIIGKFLQSTVPERLKIIEEILSDENRNHQTVQDFLQALYRHIRNEKVTIKNHAIFMRDLPDLLSYASIRGASHKMILEYVACLV